MHLDAVWVEMPTLQIMLEKRIGGFFLITRLVLGRRVFFNGTSFEQNIEPCFLIKCCRLKHSSLYGLFYFESLNISSSYFDDEQ